MQQHPFPGQHLVRFCGDTIEFTLTLPHADRGEARVRTNIGHADTLRRAIIRETQERQPRLAEDWFDIPMKPVSDRQWRLALPLTEVGHFEAKSFFLPEGETQPHWPDGANTVLNVHPASCCCANTLYNAFVRQFGQDRCPSPRLASSRQQVCDQLEEQAWTVIPPSGTFRDLARELDFIVGNLGCRILLLLPIHPTPTVYGRMGVFGSPYAALDFMDVDPALAEFDRKATPLDQFRELVDAVHARSARLYLDIAINHTGWAARIHSQHPEWLAREADGAIRSPGAWGVTWEDLTELRHDHFGLWHYLAEVFLTWCRRGVDGFRCDAGYMIPEPAWEFIVACVRREFPDTVFLLEGLGGKWETTAALLNHANLTLAYSELFQNYDRDQIQAYLPGAFAASDAEGLLMHFAETHDNARMAAKSTAYARMRTALSALCAPCGAFGFANGVEWFATDRIDVHERSSLNWGAALHQTDWIATLTALLSSHACFCSGARLRLIQEGAGNSVAVLREHPGSGARLLVLVNLDDQQGQPVNWNNTAAALPLARCVDVLSGQTPAFKAVGDHVTVQLATAQVLCLSADPEDVRRVAEAREHRAAVPAPILRQRFRAKALEAAIWRRGLADISDVDVDDWARRLAADPAAFCRSLTPGQAEPGMVTWLWPRDVKRQVMAPPNHFLCLRAPVSFRVDVCEGDRVVRREEALPSGTGDWFALCPPLPEPLTEPLERRLELVVYEPAGVRHATGHILILPDGRHAQVRQVFSREDLLDTHRVVLGTNGRGGMMRAGVVWAEIRSRYDALLAGNLSVDFPEDRRIMLTRCRGWLVYQGYSQDITLDRLRDFVHEPNGGLWRFRVPFGHGHGVGFSIRLEMIRDKNAIRFTFFREPADPVSPTLGDHQAVRLILRPDVEDRSFHEDTKAFAGPEKSWPGAVQARDKGFVFSPDPARQLSMVISAGGFKVESEWHYMVGHPIEAERGMEATGDVFSPGWFWCDLKGGEESVLMAQILTPMEPAALPAKKVASQGRANVSASDSIPLLRALEGALRHYIVKRGDLKTVVAGYPWFLDWGRDTFICARGLIAAGLLDDVKAIIKQFARFEDRGTLPNVIYGDNASNRDTSDAALWFIVACSDWCQAAGHQRLLEESCGQRTVLDALCSIASGIIQGTPNGICLDPDSALVFSPPHYTWMDTNFPAATPRQGYPIEIQALWIVALDFLGTVAQKPEWVELGHKARRSIERYFWRPKQGWFSDCLHASPGLSAVRAVPDDALRPNQLFALSLGAIQDRAIGESVLNACSELLIPGAIRSLADRPVEIPLRVERDGQLLNDPARPYWGRYEGDEDTRRKLAYHNGTAWSWPFPAYCEAWHKVYGPAGRDTALSVLASAVHIINQGCLGQIPEILDGDWPHTPRGCDAQAWGVTELYRVLTMLSH